MFKNYPLSVSLCTGKLYQSLHQEEVKAEEEQDEEPENEEHREENAVVSWL